MTKLNIYLNFNGNCKDAFNFYKEVFNTKFAEKQTFGELPTDACPPDGIPDNYKDKIMHVGIPIGKYSMLMGCDAPPWGEKHKPGNNYSVSLAPDNLEETKAIFGQLSQGGQILMPLEKTFWKAYFGMLKDKFGISWMINFQIQ